MAMNVQLVSTTNRNNTGYKQEVSGNAAHVMETVAGVAQSRSRLQTGIVGTRQSVTWTTGVNDVTVSVYREAATDEFSVLAVCFDAPSDAVADAWLATTESASMDYQCVYIRAGENRTFFLSSEGITRLDMIRIIGATALTVIVEAA